jgi:cell fate (sporulation/competence/biofilm development) regulator YmcA (YheA/YmcA/DUF963 family)
MFWERRAMLRDSDTTNNIIQHTKLVTVSHKIERFMFYNSNLHKVDKHKAINSQYSNIKSVQQWATSSTSWLMFVFCLQ